MGRAMGAGNLPGLDRKMENLIEILFPVLPLLLIVLLDTCLGDPVYPFHLIRLMGKALSFWENLLFRWGWNQRGGGIVLALILLILFVGPVWWIQQQLKNWPWWADLLFQGLVGFHCFALRDLIVHVHRVNHALLHLGIEKSRQATSMMVGRDTANLDAEGCRRAAVESLAENLTDGVITPLFWYLLLGLPGMVAFKVISTMDSMVGYKNERYFYFGWAGARLDDLLNWIPARLTWLTTVILSFLIPGLSGRKALRIGWNQHALLPGPNSGWSEAAFAGALQVRLVGPIYSGGKLATTLWIGDSQDQTSLDTHHIQQAILLAIGITLTLLTLFCVLFVLWK